MKECPGNSSGSDSGVGKNKKAGRLPGQTSSLKSRVLELNKHRVKH